MSSAKPVIESAIKRDEITFSFGENWSDYVAHLSDDAIGYARSDIEGWLGPKAVAGKTVLDIGCGSGIHSLCFYQLGAKNIVSIDVDPKSIDATRVMWEKAGRPANWRITHGSVLDSDFVGGLGQHDIVYSWGVLHHTGEMWTAIANAASRVAPGGRFWIAIYAKGPKYPKHLRQKQRYNRASKPVKKLMVWKYISGLMRDRRRAGLNPFTWNERDGRGMDTYHDVIDWLGGLPYEVASRDEVVEFCGERGFVLEKIKEVPEGGNNIFLFSLPS